MAKTKRTVDQRDPPSFEEALQVLETVVAELESGTLGLSEALARYEQGVKHLDACQKVLQQAERKIELLSGVDAQGNPITQPLDDRAHDTLDEKASARGRRRTSQPREIADKRRPAGGDVDDSRQLF